MNVLFVVPYVPNLIRVRPYNLIRALIAEGHSITLATLWSDEDDRHDIETLLAAGVTKVIARQLTQTRALLNSLRVLPTNRPLQANYCWHPGLTTAISEELRTQRYDVVHVEHLRGAIYGLRALSALSASNYRVPVVWDSVDSISHLFAQAAKQSASRKDRIMTRLELNRTRQHEAKLAGAFDRILVTSAADKESFLNICRDENIADRFAVVPNGVDTAYFHADRSEAQEPTLLISGKMSYHANLTMVLHLVNDIMPLVWASRPEVKVWIVGKDPPASIRQLGDYMPGNAAISAHPGAPTSSVVVTGTVPDIRPYLRQATLAVAPVLYGAGIQNKVIEAMACGLPVVASPIAVSALDIVEGRDVLVATGAKAFAQQILALLADPARRA